VKSQEDVVNLAPKTRFALATDVVNLALKVLTHSSKAHAAQKDASPATSSHGLRAAAGPVQDVSETMNPNKITQIRKRKALPAGAAAATQIQRKGGSGQDDLVLCNGTDTHVVCTAEIARLGFLYLRSVDTTKHGLREPQRLQLESGTLALVARLLALDLNSLAIKELFAAKKMLEESGSTSNVGKARVLQQKLAVRENVTTLLDLQMDLEKNHMSSASYRGNPMPPLFMIQSATCDVRNLTLLYRCYYGMPGFLIVVKRLFAIWRILPPPYQVSFLHYPDRQTLWLVIRR
jgi:hypothetical protein